MTMNRSDQRAFQDWLDLCIRIGEGTKNAVPIGESEVDKEKRKARLCDNFEAFCKFYFPRFMDSEFGWFHKKAAKEIIQNPNIKIVLEWAREHAKSVFADVMMPLFLYAKGELTGMVVVSANEDKAQTLLGDLQAQFVANHAWLNDYGNLASLGDWRDGYFATTEGVGFWAFGLGQSPRGIRKAEKRPNYAVIDDGDTKERCRNESRTREAVDWIWEDLYGALSIKGARLIVAGNRIHKKSIIAQMVGDIEPQDPKRVGITHIKVFAIENPKTHAKADFNNGQPAWKRYTLDDLRQKFEGMPYRSVRREYFHEHIEEGIIFRNEWIRWGKIPKVKDCDGIVLYGDPSFKNTKDSDYKALVEVRLKGSQLYIAWAWVRQATVSAMVTAFYDRYDVVGNACQYFIEANMLQDMFLDEFKREGDRRGYQLPIRGDQEKKIDKFTRVENMTPLFERNFVTFNEAERQSPDMQTLIQQILAFGSGANDDGPDALQGAVAKLQKQHRRTDFKPRYGNYKVESERRYN